MFNVWQLRDRLASTRRWPEQSPPAQRFESRDSSEQCVEVWRAPLGDFGDALDFCIQATGYRARSEWVPLCRPIGRREFLQAFGWLDEAEWADDWRPAGVLRETMLMADDGLDVQAICLTDREYYYVNWYTTA